MPLLAPMPVPRGGCPPRLRALLLALLLLLPAARACVLQGQDSGHCVPTSAAAALLPFCAPYVTLYPSVCLPNEYAAFPNHTATAKDAWVRAQVGAVVARRLDIENTNGQGFTLRACSCGAQPPRCKAPRRRLSPCALCPPPRPCNRSALGGHPRPAAGALSQEHRVPGGVQELLLLH
jgi:hypothetical protein